MFRQRPEVPTAQNVPLAAFSCVLCKRPHASAGSLGLQSGPAFAAWLKDQWMLSKLALTLTWKYRVSGRLKIHLRAMQTGSPMERKIK